MASEIQASAQLGYTNTPAGIPLQSLGSQGTKFFNITGKNYSGGTMSVPTTAGGTAIPKGSIGTLGWAVFINNDATNYIQLMSAVSGTVFIKLLPGEFALFRFDSGISAPAAISNTAPCLLEFLMLEN